VDDDLIPVEACDDVRYSGQWYFEIIIVAGNLCKRPQ
jgi:hypothetical protein